MLVLGDTRVGSACPQDRWGDVVACSAVRKRSQCVVSRLVGAPPMSDNRAGAARQSLLRRPGRAGRVR